jgi:hypothetical protein
MSTEIKTAPVPITIGISLVIKRNHWYIGD